MLLPLIILTLIKADDGCCGDACRDCIQEVETFQEYNPLYAPITFGTSLLDYSLIRGQGSSLGTDGWFNSTTANPYYTLSNEKYALPTLDKCSEFAADAILTFSSQLLEGQITSPLGINQDPMYGSGVFGLVDIASGWEFKFLLTNTRVFAVLSHQRVGPPSITNNLFTFTYAIPIACRRPKDINQYRLILRPSIQAVWFQIDGKDRLRVCHPGRPPIAEKFLIAQNGGDTYQNGFPSVVQVALGFEVQPQGHPNAACQQAIFDYGKESIYEAKGTCCEYAPYQDPAEYLIGLKMKYFELNVVQTFCGQECPGPCCPGCDEITCNRPIVTSSSCSSSCSSSSSSSSSLCKPPTDSNSSSYCNNRFDPHEALRSPNAPVFSQAPIRTPENIPQAVWFGGHARSARRRARRHNQGCAGTVVAREYILS